MNRAMMDHDDEMSRIWALVGELSGQLAANRELVTQLKKESENVKGQVAHVGAGFPLRRFNLDISDEEFQTELEAFSTHLVLENQQLQHENKQLNTLLKEYEQTLESVMSKFRGIAHASQQHDLSLHSYYSSLLQSLQTAHSTAQLHDDTSLSLLLTRLSTLLRAALRSLGGEDPEAGTDLLASIPALLHQPSAQPNGDSTTTKAAGSSRPSSPTQSSSSLPGQSRPTGVSRAPKRTPFAGSLPGAKGGYAGTEGQGDWALEREMEILRLEEENKMLRDMLNISEEIAALDEPAAEIESSTDMKSPSASDMGRRKSSITIEELEAGAEHDDSARLRQQEIERKNPLDSTLSSATNPSSHENERQGIIWGSTNRFSAAEGFETIDMSGSALLTGTEEDAEPDLPAPGAEQPAPGWTEPVDKAIENTDEGIIQGGHGLVAPAVNEAPDAEPVEAAPDSTNPEDEEPKEELIDLMSA